MIFTGLCDLNTSECSSFVREEGRLLSAQKNVNSSRTNLHLTTLGFKVTPFLIIRSLKKDEASIVTSGSSKLHQAYFLVSFHRTSSGICNRKTEVPHSSESVAFCSKCVHWRLGLFEEQLALSTPADHSWTAAAIVGKTPCSRLIRRAIVVDNFQWESFKSLAVDSSSSRRSSAL